MKYVSSSPQDDLDTQGHENAPQNRPATVHSIHEGKKAKEPPLPNTGLGQSQFALVAATALEKLKEHSTLTHVYVALAVHADSAGKCWPSYDRLAKITGLSKKTIQRHVKKLLQLKLIFREAAGGAGWTYLLPDRKTNGDKHDC